MITLTHKQLLELKYWFTYDEAHELQMLKLYFDALQIHHVPDGEILEIGTGPLWGMLPYINARRKVGIDSLYSVYDKAGILADRNGILAVNDQFELWETNDTFDVIVTTNALDHGEMGFNLIVKMWRMLKPKGVLYIHVHLRPYTLLNLIHDHCLSEKQLDQHLSYTNLVQIHRKIFRQDVDDKFCPALVGAWVKPE